MAKAVCGERPIETVSVACGAASKPAPPGWSAVIVQVPPLRIVALPVGGSTVQMLGDCEPKTTGKPEVDVAETVNDPSVYCGDAGLVGPKEIDWPCGGAGTAAIPMSQVLACDVRTVRTALPDAESIVADDSHGSGAIDGDVAPQRPTATPLRKTTSWPTGVDPNADASRRNVNDRGLAVDAAGASITASCPTRL